MEDIPVSTVFFTRRLKKNYKNTDVSVERWLELFQMVSKQKLRVVGPVILTYHNNPLEQFFKTDCDLEISIQVTRPGTSPSASSSAASRPLPPSTSGGTMRSSRPMSRPSSGSTSRATPWTAPSPRSTSSPPLTSTTRKTTSPRSSSPFNPGKKARPMAFAFLHLTHFASGRREHSRRPDRLLGGSLAGSAGVVPDLHDPDDAVAAGIEVGRLSVFQLPHPGRPRSGCPGCSTGHWQAPYSSGRPPGPCSCRSRRSQAQP